MKRQVVSIFLLFILLSTSLFVLIGCGSSQGIPHGIYYPLDENGKVMKRGLEYGWQIKEDSAEYLYRKYEIKEEDDKLYFVWESSNSEIPIVQYEIEYDKKTKTLTVFMPDKRDNEGRPLDGSVITAYLFKK